MNLVKIYSACMSKTAALQKSAAVYPVPSTAGGYINHETQHVSNIPSATATQQQPARPATPAPSAPTSMSELSKMVRPALGPIVGPALLQRNQKIRERRNTPIQPNDGRQNAPVDHFLEQLRKGLQKSKERMRPLLA